MPFQDFRGTRSISRELYSHGNTRPDGGASNKRSLRPKPNVREPIYGPPSDIRNIERPFQLIKHAIGATKALARQS